MLRGLQPSDFTWFWLSSIAAVTFLVVVMISQVQFRRI
jgi:hypothetical protein